MKANYLVHAVVALFKKKSVCEARYTLDRNKRGVAAQISAKKQRHDFRVPAPGRNCSFYLDLAL